MMKFDSRYFFQNDGCKNKILRYKPNYYVSSLNLTGKFYDNFYQVSFA